MGKETMNLLEIYLIISTIALAFVTVIWRSDSLLNQCLKGGMLLLTILGSFLALNAIGFALGME
jgi:hypothetical protein